jgi:hypothetical protein
MRILQRWRKAIQAAPFAAVLMAVGVGIAIEHGATKPPVVTRKGIRWKSVNVTPQGVSGEWEAEDSRIQPGAEYIIEYRKKAIMLGDSIVANPEDFEWREFARTKDERFAKECWLLDSTFDLRVRTVVQEGDENVR